jgi:hypothetical protein
MAPRTERIVVWVEPETKRMLKRIAEHHQRTVSGLLRMAARHIAASDDCMQAQHAKGITDAVRQATAATACKPHRK